MRSLNPWPIFPFNLDPPVAQSLCIQFILQELIDSFEVLKALQAPPQMKKKEIARIFKELEKLLLFSLENPFAQKGSTLDNLCFYCEILLQTSHVEESEILVILETMRSEILKIKSKMIPWKKMGVPFGQIQGQLLQLYADLHRGFCQFFSAFIPFLKEAHSDENVLIFLIENKEKLNASFGPRSIEKLLQSFFPTGHAQLKAIIYEGYTRRGFIDFLSSVGPLIDAIEWETPCHSPAIL